MRMKELQKAFLDDKIEKKLYWTLMREQYMRVLPQLMEVLEGHEECKSIVITAEGVILEKKNGLKLFFDFQESMSRAEIDLCNGVDPEKVDMEIISELLGKRDAKVMLDVGANVGMFSLTLYLEHPDMSYHIFEPIPATYSKLLKTLKLNKADEKNIHPYNLGMSNERGNFKFYLPGESEAASLQPVEDMFYRKQSDKYGNYSGSLEMKEVDCQVTTIDEFVKEGKLESVDFIKIDVEGNEKFVLEGARETLEKYHPLIYCELLRKHAKRFGYHPNDVIAYMKELGYMCSTVRNGVMVDIELIEEDTQETNFIFTEKSK